MKEQELLMLSAAKMAERELKSLLGINIEINLISEDDDCYGVDIKVSLIDVSFGIELGTFTIPYCSSMQEATVSLRAMAAMCAGITNWRDQMNPSVSVDDVKVY